MNSVLAWRPWFDSRHRQNKAARIGCYNYMSRWRITTNSSGMSPTGLAESATIAVQLQMLLQPC